MQVYSPEGLQAATSYLLGRAHSGISYIIASHVSIESKIESLELLERELRADIEKIYYPTPEQV